MEGTVDKEIQELVLSDLPVVKKCAFGNECNGNGFLGENNFSAFPVLPVEKENISRIKKNKTPKENGRWNIIEEMQKK